MPALTTEQEFFAEHGWAVSYRIFDDYDVEIINRHFDDVLAGKNNTGRAPDGIDSFGGKMVKVSQAHWADGTIRSVVFNHAIARAAAELLQTEEIYLWADSLYWKAPLAYDEQSKVGWHQDRQYWPTSSSDKMITACVALYHANSETGGMRFADGSHKWGLVGGSDALVGFENTGEHERPALPEGAVWNEQCPILKPGQATFHHSLTFHGSGPNYMETPRRSITIHMVSGEARLSTQDGHTAFEGMQCGDPFRPPKFPKLWPRE